MFLRAHTLASALVVAGSLFGPLVNAIDAVADDADAADAAADTSAPGKVKTFILPSCNDATWLGNSKKHDWTLGPDSCLSVSTSTSFRIETPAVCANGTRARLARYEGRGCNNGEVTVQDGLSDLLDGDMDKARCFDMLPDSLVGRDDVPAYASFSFYCDGKRSSSSTDEDNGSDNGNNTKNKPKSKSSKGSVSLNACRAKGDDSHMRAPTFRHPDPDTCVNVPARQPVKLYQPAVCRDGSEAQLATWKGRGCAGNEPLSLKPVAADELGTCMLWDESDETSFAFWCDGDIRRDEDRARRSRGSVAGFIGVMFIIGIIGITILAVALMRWAEIVKRILNLTRKNGAIAL